MKRVKFCKKKKKFFDITRKITFALQITFYLFVKSKGFEFLFVKLKKT